MTLVRRLCCILLTVVAMTTITSGVNAQTAKAKVSTLSIGKADGVGIWIHPTDKSKSLVIGADPSKGLGTFDLKGALIEVVNFGKGGAGEVDVRYNFPLNGRKISIVVSANNKQNTLRIFTVDPQTCLLEEITGKHATLGINAYGSCLYHSVLTGKFYSFVTSREGLIEQWELFDNGQGKVDAVRVRQINIMEGAVDPKADHKIEACVGDDELGWVYIAQERECQIWRYGAEPGQGSKRLLVDMAMIDPEDNVEGLALYRVGKTDGYLVISIQNSWKYKVYNRKEPNQYLGTFDLTQAGSSALIESHDCIEITHLNLGEQFPQGFLVTQNSKNVCGPHYQLVPWPSIAKLFNLKVDLSYNPYNPDQPLPKLKLGHR